MTESASEHQSIYRFRWLGYGLLIFALIDALQVLIPLNLTNAAWELQTIGLLVDRVTIPLLGVVLVFFGESHDRSFIEKTVLKLLSWLCLVLAIGFLLLMPLGILGTARLDAQTERQINQQVEQQVAQLNQLENQLKQGNADETRTAIAQLNRIGLSVAGQTPTELKSEGLLGISQARLQIQEQSEASRASQQSVLLKNSVKWNLGAVVASALFFVLWKSTSWAR